jgi:hypothetical protein
MEEIKKIELPTVVSGPIRKNPKSLIIFSKPKTGKTSALSQLPNCLIIDLENGSDFISGLILKANNLGELRQIGEAILEKKKETGKFPYEYVVIDTVTKLEEMCIPFAEQLYSKSPMGANWFTKGKAQYGNILGLPNGSGYLWFRISFDRTMAFVQTLAENVILSGHVKDTLLSKEGVDFSSLDIDLTGKNKKTLATDSDSIGYLYRKGNTNILSFRTTDDVACGSRAKHLRNKEIIISEIQEVGTENEKLVTFWKEIYI